MGSTPVAPNFPSKALARHWPVININDRSACSHNRATHDTLVSVKLVQECQEKIALPNLASALDVVPQGEPACVPMNQIFFNNDNITLREYHN